MTRVIKTKTRALVRQGMKPNQIRNLGMVFFQLDAQRHPTLQTVQNFVYNYKRSTLQATDVVQDMVSAAKKTQKPPVMDEREQFRSATSLTAKARQFWAKAPMSVRCSSE